VGTFLRAILGVIGMAGKKSGVQERREPEGSEHREAGRVADEVKGARACL
jgi:hypothetical protein